MLLWKRARNNYFQVRNSYSNRYNEELKKSAVTIKDESRHNFLVPTSFDNYDTSLKNINFNTFTI